jgi:hypothetical protein
MNRRTFVAKAVAAGFSTSLAAVADQIEPGLPHSTKLGWRISVQHWTYRRVPLFEGLEMAAKVGLRCFEPRSILTLDAGRPGVNADENMPEDARKELKARADDLGIAFPSVFADFNGQPGQARKMLEFWKSLGVASVVSEPPPVPLTCWSRSSPNTACNSPPQPPAHQVRVLAPGHRARALGTPWQTHRRLLRRRPMDTLRSQAS